MDVPARLVRLRQALADQPCDALVVSHLPNIRWLSGFTGSAGTAIVTDTECVLITDGRYSFQAPREIAAAKAEVEVHISASAKEQSDMIAEALKGVSAVGLEAEHISWARQISWAKQLSESASEPPGTPPGKPPATPPATPPVPIEGLVEGLRRRKDPGEVARVAAAASLVDEAMREIFELLSQPGAEPNLSEHDLAAELDYRIRRRGASELAFETIVASGENSALPHARPSRRQIQPGELLLIDVGAVYDGYRSDMTRTFSLEQPSQKEAEIWQVVREAQQLGVEAVRADMTAGEVDQVCRQKISEHGWGNDFMHSTGHGVGLEIHEAPSVSAKSKDVLEPGEIITVEPGIYLRDLAGVRLEDTVLVEPDGCRPLTQTPKFLSLSERGAGAG